jgi:hypothetical protein
VFVLGDAVACVIARQQLPEGRAYTLLRTLHAGPRC